MDGNRGLSRLEGRQLRTIVLPWQIGRFQLHIFRSSIERNLLLDPIGQ